MSEKRADLTAEARRVTVRLALLALTVAALGLFPLSHTATDYLHAGDGALEAGDFDAALDAYQAAASAAPWDALPLDRAAHAEAMAGRYEAAARDLRRVAAMVGWDAGLHRRLGDTLRAQGEVEAAVAEWEAALALAPGDVAALRALAGVYQQQKAWADAISALERLVALEPGDAAARYRLGLMVASFDPAAALQHLAIAAADPMYTDPATTIMRRLDALFDEPDRAYANVELAVTLISLEAWAAAEAALVQALLVSPAYADALVYLGLVQDQQGENGLPSLQEAVELAPESALARYALGRHYVEAGDYDAAIPALIQAAALDPDNPAIAAGLGAAYRGRGDLEDAAYWLRRAAAMDEENVHAWEQLASFYAETGYQLEDEGLTAIRTAAQRAPDSADVRASLGWALYQTGDTAAAQREVAQALALDARDAHALYYHGVLLELAGDRAGAVDAYQDVIEVAPESRLAALAARGLARLSG